jgi:alpha-glucosidase (family GH31 glycosyl hydrolase)
MKLSWKDACTIKTLLLCTILLAGLAPLAAAPATLARISPLPDGVELADGTSLLDVRILENRLVCVHVRPNGQSTPRTLVIDPRPVLRRPSAITRSEQNGVYKLSTQSVSVQIQKAKPYSIAFLDAQGNELLRTLDPFGEAGATGVTMQRSRDEALYGIHGLDRDDTSGGLLRNDGGKVAAGAQGNSGAPFVFSTRYGLLVDSDGGEFSTDPGSISFRHSSRPDVEYFVLAGPPLETMASLSRLVGPPPLPPKWTLGFMNSQWGSTQAEVEQIVARYRTEQLPLDGFILDFDWKAWGEDNYGEWRWNSTSGAGNADPDKFPDGASGAFAQGLAAQGVKLAGILKPRILTTVAGDPNQPTVAAAYATSHGFWYPGEAPYKDYVSHRLALDLDFSNAEERAWFWQHLLPAFHTGMAAWWNDEADINRTFTFGNFQFLNMGRALYEGQRADSDLRVWSINRNFYLGASRYGYAGWSGDIGTGFDNMALQRRRMIAALNTGEFHWGMDTGGFSGHPTSENYARWIEFAAFVPIMRVHGGYHEKRQPWVYGPVAEAAARDALDLRYQLLPYIYSYERLTTEGEVGLVRPLLWEFPSDPVSATQDTEWMFGDALLVSPVVSQGATAQQIYLPPGNWFNYANGQRYAGAQNVEVATDAETWKDIPLFVRDGSIIATQPLEQYVGQHPTAEITLDIFPAETSAAFTAYDDDGSTYGYEKGNYLRQQITARRNNHGTQVSIAAATGNYSSPLRTYLLRIHAAANKVMLNGAAVSAGSATSTPGKADKSWARQQDRFGPVVVIRVPAGARRTSVITLQ